MPLTKQIQQPMVVFNVGWMKHYQGLSNKEDVITGKAKFIDEKKWGYEIYNFLPFEGKVYGFVQPSGHGKDYLERQIRIENIDSKVQATSEYIDDVLVVWVAPYPQGGTYLVGWYEHARIYRHYQETSSIKRHYENQILGYFATANEIDAVCLHEADRITDELKLQRANSAKEDNKGGLGHSFVWFARIDESRPYNLKFREKILAFISKYKQKNQHYIENNFCMK